MTTRELNRTLKSGSGDGDIPFWTTSSGEGDRPGLLLIPAIFGADDGTKTLARDLAAAGATVWVVDPFWRTSPGVIARDREGFGKGIERARGMDVELAASDFSELIEALANEEGCNGNVAVLGLCFAGKFSLMLASQGHVAAGASFHGPGMAALASLGTRIRVPLSLHFGDADVAIPVSDVGVLREAFEGHDNVEVFLHEGGVKHGFGDPGSDGFNPLVYSKCLAAMHRLLDGLR